MTRVAAIIVNYRSARLVMDLLRSIAGKGPGWIASVVVVDNASGDGSSDVLKDGVARLGLNGLVGVVDSPRNGGFGAGNNLGAQAVLQRGDVDLIWFLNPDTLVDGTELGPTLEHFRRNTQVGIVGTGLTSGSGDPEPGAHRDLTPASEFVRNAGALRVLRRYSASGPELERSGAADWVSGASLLVRTSTFESLGGFDEAFFLYFEEVDLCRRARREGWEVRYEPATRVVHLEGQTTGVKATHAKPRYWYESRQRYFLKHSGIGGLLAADFAWVLGRAVGRLRGRPSDGCCWRDIWRCDKEVIMTFDDRAAPGVER